MRTSIRTLPPPDTFSSRHAVSPPQPPPPAQHSALVVTSLAQLRSGPRCTNEYVDSPRSRPSIPLKAQLQSPALAAVGGGGGLPTSSIGSPRLRPHGGAFTNGGGGLHNINSHQHQQQLTLHQLATTRSAHGSSGLSSPNTTSLSTSGSPVLVVSRQPLSKSPSLKKDAGDSPIIPLDGYGRDADGGGLHTAGLGTATSTLGTSAAGGDGSLPTQGSGSGVRTTHGGIICEDCGKCRCGACTERRELPCGTWCCGGKCELTPAKVLDICTCFCAVKCLFFHCRRGEEEEDDNECYENPCGCLETPRCCPRWTVLGLMSACLPCLWTYWPARACLAASTAAYNSCCRHKGCQCELTQAGNAANAASAGSTTVGGSSATKSVLSSGRGGGGGGGGIGGTGTKNSKHSQARRLLIESDSSSA
ncbi:hypothetical protein EGW08_013340 [Elysia chlorotica]|uniref:Protein sprouty n=1 Tax=Elysia chlorotica TaxID=188477 RepID=A0A433TBC6_ELYCH|nr:hypothetical protein EGW08_013340 [Elysia chlorotica]